MMKYREKLAPQMILLGKLYGFLKMKMKQEVYQNKNVSALK